MTVFARPPDVIIRDPVPVMLAVCADDLPEIQRLWASFEDLVGLRGRKMYAVVDSAAGTYATCTPVGTDDDADALGLALGQLPGGRFRRGRLRGQAPHLYSLIGAGVDELEQLGLVDRSRQVVEFYKRADEIELWVPIDD